MPHATSSQGTIHADINYFKQPTSGEYGIQRSNSAGYKCQEPDTRRVEVTDIRGNENDFDLDKNGFQVVRGFDLPYELWADDEKIKQQAYSEARDLVKRVYVISQLAMSSTSRLTNPFSTGCSHVSVFSHIVRRDTWEEAIGLARTLPADAPIKLSHPSKIAHIGKSVTSSKIRAASDYGFGRSVLSRRQGHCQQCFGLRRSRSEISQSVGHHQRVAPAEYRQSFAP